MEIKMRIKKKVFPLPSIDYVVNYEIACGRALPEEYKDFIWDYNGGIPIENCFNFSGKEYRVERFLSFLEDHRVNPLGEYDVDVAETNAGERFSDEPDKVASQKIPFVLLEGGDFICFDYKENPQCPSICIWYNKRSTLFKPVVDQIAANYEQFIEMLHE
jgi:hypothetical protein